MIRSIRFGAKVGYKPPLRAFSLNSTPQAVSDADVSKINVYTAYTIYKGRGAMSLKIIKPTWERTPNGNGIRVAREGTMLLEFAQSKGERVYDWENKGTFAMSAVECGEILESCESGEERSFFHDPNKMGMTEGTINKTLKFSPARDSGYFFSLYVNDKSTGGTSRFDTAVSSAELRVIQNLLDFSIPRLLGFDEVFAGAPDIKETTFTEGDYPPF